LKILAITPGFLPSIGGAEIGVHEIYSRLGSRHSVTILTQSQKTASGKSIEGFDQNNYTVREYRDFLNFGRIGGRMLMRGSIPPFSIGALFGSIKTIRRLNPDVINVHYAAYTGLSALWAQKASKIPTVLSLVGRDSAPGPLVPKLWPWYASLIARQVAHTVFISEYSQSYFLKFNFASSIIPYGVDINKITPKLTGHTIVKLLDLPPDIYILFSLQRLTLLKHVEIAIHSARILVNRGIDNFVLLIGGEGPLTSELKGLVDNLGLHKYVRFLGFVPENQINTYFKSADIFVLPSIYETFGIVLAQAMAAGLPVVATNTSAIPEVVQDGVTGLLTPPLDPEAMADNIELLLCNDDLRYQLGHNGRKRAEKHYDWNQIAHQYEQVLSMVRNDN
jgi:glycosyltransferase involved in cell wall biosynthesis